MKLNSLSESDDRDLGPLPQRPIRSKNWKSDLQPLEPGESRDQESSSNKPYDYSNHNYDEKGQPRMRPMLPNRSKNQDLQPLKPGESKNQESQDKMSEG